MAYPLPLDTAYRSSDIKTEALIFVFDFVYLSFLSTEPILLIVYPLFQSLSLDELRSPNFNLFSDQEYSEEEEAEVMAETMEQYMSKTRMDYGSGIARHVLTRQILDSRGAVPSKTTTDAKKAIQEMAEYSQKWHNGTSRGRSTETSDGLDAIQAQLNNLGREIKKVNEKVYADQVGCGGYRATAPGFYQRNNTNPLCQERRQSMEDTLSKFMGELAKRHEENSNLIKEIRASTDVAIRNQGASIKTLEIQIRKMIIMEYLVKDSKRHTFWSLNEDILKITILETNTPYPSRKIRCIRACTHQRPQRNEAQYAVSRRTQYTVLKI
ncbi:hypothetical protein Tco_1091120 [Tanacetum coccineum]|uniref:Uncharacterized protein n=1 Tax=Tanacetum coccineum TaxID=301880 RepID=A0ABQ5I8H6_9ASTR